MPTTNRWIGLAPAIAKVITLTVASSTAAQTFTVTINSKVVSYTAGSGETTATIAAALYALLNACVEPEFKEVAWTYPGTLAIITGTAQTAGRPFTVTVGGTGTLTLATPTASSGPNHIDLTANWSAGTLPAATNDVLVDGGPDMLWGWENLTAAAYNSLRVKASFCRGGPGGCNGLIGLDYWNPNGYREYRGRGWPVATTVPLTVGEGDGDGPSRFNITSGLVLAADIIKTGQRAATSIPVVNIAGCTSGVLNASRSDVALAADDDTLAATVTTATIGAGANLVNGHGGVITTLNQNDGVVQNLGAVGTLNGKGGRFDHYGTISTAVVADPSGFKFNWLCGGTIPAVTFRGQGPGQSAPVMDCTVDQRQKTMTAHSFTGGAKLNDPDQLTVWTAAGTWDAASLAASVIGDRFTLART